MSHYGLIFTAYQSEEFLTPGPENTLQSWVDLRTRLAPHKLTICAVCVPFEGFDHGGVAPDKTEEILRDRLATGHIDHLVTSAVPLKETEARGRALAWLRDEAKVDIQIQADSDELFTERDIRGIVGFVESNPWINWFKVAYRNAVFDKRTFLVDPFTPARIHRVHAPGGYVADSFYDDNNVRYWRPWEKDKVGGAPLLDAQMSVMTVPSSLAYPKHWSWLDNERSRLKQKYQRLRWGHCSFRWDETENHLRFDESYFAAQGLPLPEVIRE